ncbi:MAG: stalk domain-containing protein [Clostridia bacterium]|nr:stalk domain-containing protein [Clostridia bacterium]
MKKLNILLYIILMLFALVPADAKAEQVDDSQIPIDIMVNDCYIKTDAKSFLEKNTTYVPVRFVSEALGADEIIWEGDSRSVIISEGETTIKFTIGSRYVYVNSQKIVLENSIRLINDRSFVPVRFVSEILGATVNWNSTYYTVEIKKDGIAVPENLKNTNYNENDILWLARIIEAESAGEPMNGKIGVGNVILNRVKSSSFPDTIYDVIFDRNFGVQFEPVLNGRIYNEPSPASIIAAKRALAGENVVGASLYFLNPQIASSLWILENRIFYASIANHDFYL